MSDTKHSLLEPEPDFSGRFKYIFLTSYFVDVCGCSGTSTFFKTNSPSKIGIISVKKCRVLLMRAVDGFITLDFS